MSRLLLGILLLALGCTEAPIEAAATELAAPPAEVSAASETVSPEAVEVADGRAPAAEVDLDGWGEQTIVIEAMEAAQAYWRMTYPDASWLFEFTDTAAGSFTIAGAQQVALLYSVGSAGACCPLAGLAVLENGEVVRNVAFGGGTALRALPDVDGDGRNELVVTGGGTNMGRTVASATVAEMGDDGLDTWGLAFVYEDDCGNGAGRATAMRLWAVPGPTPAFDAERFEADGACDGNPAWTSVGKLAPVVLEPVSGDPPVSIPVR